MYGKDRSELLLYYIDYFDEKNDSTLNDLRNKFHFSDIHRSMKAVGLVQSKWLPKMKFISYTCTLFLHGFYSFSYVWCFDKKKKNCKIIGEEKL